MRLSPKHLARTAAIIVALDVAYVFIDGAGANDRRLATLSAVYGLLVLSMVVLTGFAGQISFVQAELAGFGALTTAALVSSAGWSFWLALPVAVAGSVFVGVIVGLPALRLQGLILGVVTIALALGFDAFVFTLGAYDGVLTVERPSLLGWDLADDKATFAFVLLVLVALAFLVANLQRAKTGRVFAAIRDSEVAARTAGVDVTRYKLLAFAISAGLAGLAGGLLDLTVGSADKQSFTLLFSISIASVIILMGPAFVASAFAGGVFLAWGSELLVRLGVDAGYFNIILGVGLIVQLILAPDGVVAQGRQVVDRFRRLRARWAPS